MWKLSGNDRTEMEGHTKGICSPHHTNCLWCKLHYHNLGRTSCCGWIQSFQECGPPCTTHLGLKYMEKKIRTQLPTPPVI